MGLTGCAEGEPVEDGNEVMELEEGSLEVLPMGQSCMNDASISRKAVLDGLTCRALGMCLYELRTIVWDMW